MAKRKPAEIALEKLQKKFPKAALYLGSNVPKICGYIETGSLGLDLNLGRGIPRGRITQYQGEDSSGKTAMALHGVAKLQRKQNDAKILWVAAEPFEKDWAANNGVDLENIVVLNPYEAEDAFDVALYGIEENIFDIEVIDSAAALCPKEVDEKGSGGRHMGVDARVIGQFCRMTGPRFNRAQFRFGEARTAVIIINQVRDSFNQFEHEPKASGGRGLKHHKGFDVYFKKSGFIDNGVKGEGKEIIGGNVVTRLVKVKITGGLLWSKANFDYYTRDNEKFWAGTIDVGKEIRIHGAINGILNFIRGSKKRKPSCEIVLGGEVFDVVKGDTMDDVRAEVDHYFNQSYELCEEAEKEIKSIVQKKRGLV